ncbi:glycosyltransferase family 4 protein [Paenibacillus sp. YYML68]|uniref:glycosyltransferase family 4 protein n=1 Tax=Paenibacillus sp. YYML68 TaxID=2909250 RepID=UPI0024928E71|nr:glycosyltransferase family 4 protein [Paenibacillus sp. YYML68]
MRILIIAPEQIPVPPLLGGSVEICIWAIANRLAKKHEVTVISRRHPKYPNRSEMSSRLTIVRVPSGSEGEYQKAVLKAVQSLQQRAHRGGRFDAVQVDNRPKLAAAVQRALPGTPVWLFLHSLTFVSPRKIKRKNASACLSAVHGIVANSASLREKLSARFPSVARRIREVWLGVDTEAFRQAKRRSAARSAAFRVLYAGRLVRQKGIPVLMKAVKQAEAASVGRSLSLTIAGGPVTGPYAARLKRLAASLRLRVQFLGSVPHKRMPDVYREADCLVCPSQGHEAFGLVNVEAMASGVPVIAAANGGIREIVQHRQNGLLVTKYRSPKAYASAIRKLQRSPRLAARLAKAGRRTVKSRFSWELTASRLAELYRERGSRAKR